MILLRLKSGGLLTGRLDIGAAVRLRSVGFDVMSPDLEMTAADCVDALFVVLLPAMSEGDFARDLASDPLETFQEAYAAFFRADTKARGGGRRPTSAELWEAVWKGAGIACVDPHGLTFGELMTMAEGRQRHEWDMQSSLMALIHNIHAKNSKPASYFNPFSRQRNRVDVMTASVADLAEMLGCKPWKTKHGQR